MLEGKEGHAQKGRQLSKTPEKWLKGLKIENGNAEELRCYRPACAHFKNFVYVGYRRGPLSDHVIYPPDVWSFVLDNGIIEQQANVMGATFGEHSPPHPDNKGTEYCAV